MRITITSHLLQRENYKMNIETIRQFLKGNRETIASISDISNIFQSLAAVVTIFGIVFVGLEYNRQQQTSREEKAFELYQQFNEGKFIENRNNLKKAYYEKREDNPNLQETTQDYITTMKSVWQEQYVATISIKDFFEQVATCVEKDLCDEEVTRALFGKEAQDFFETHYDFFCLERKEHKDENMGLILQEFVEKTHKNCAHIDDYIAKNP